MRLSIWLLVLGLVILAVGLAVFPGLAGAIALSAIGAIIILVALVRIFTSRQRAPKTKS